MYKVEAIYEHTSKYHGVISRKEALEAGVTSGQFANYVRQRRLERAARGVFVVSGCPPSWHQSARIAALSVDGLISHRAAAALHRIDGFDLGRRELTVARNRGPRRPQEFLLHQTTQWHLADPLEIDGLPVTGLTRTVIDVGAVVGWRRFEWLIDAVIRQELCGWHELYTVLQCHSVQGRNGCGPLRRVLDAHNPKNRVPDSIWNRMFGQLLNSRGLPEPVYEFEVLDRSGRFVARVDLAYPERRVAIELDSIRWHLNRESFERDSRRKNKLIDQGWTVLSFTWNDFSEHPNESVQIVRRAIARSA